MTQRVGRQLLTFLGLLLPFGGCWVSQQEALRETIGLLEYQPYRPGAQGPVKVEGQVPDLPTVTSPLGDDCVAWTGEVSHVATRVDSKGKRSYHTVVDCTEKGGELPRLVTGQGTALGVYVQVAQGGARTRVESVDKLRRPPCSRLGSRYTQSCVKVGDRGLLDGCLDGDAAYPCDNGLSQLSIPPNTTRLDDARTKWRWLALLGGLYLAAVGHAIGTSLQGRSIDPTRAP